MDINEQNIEERKEHHFGTMDLWDFFMVNARAQIRALIWLRENKHGYPASLTEEKWNSILDKMIDGFQAVTELEDGWSDEAELRFKKGMKAYRKWYFHLWD